MLNGSGPYGAAHAGAQDLAGMGNWNRNFKYPFRRARSLCCPTRRPRRPHLLLLVQNNYEATHPNHLQVLCETITQLPVNPQAASAGQDPGKGGKGNSQALWVGGNADGCGHRGEPNGVSSKTLKTEMPYDPAIPLLEYTQTHTEQQLKGYPRPCVPCAVTDES